MTSTNEDPESDLNSTKNATELGANGLTSLATAKMLQSTLDEPKSANNGLSNLNGESFQVKFNNVKPEKESAIYNIGWPLVDGGEPKILEKTSKRKVGSHRFHIALLGLAIAAVNSYAQATFCIAIVEMVLPADFVVKSETSQSVVRVITQPNGVPATSVVDVPDPVAFEDQSCPVEYKYRDYYDSWRFLSSENSSTPVSTASSQANTNLIDVSDRFDWDASRQGLLLGAFAIGTAPLQVLGGRLAEIYGAKWVLLAGCIGTALTNLTVPLIARFSFILLLINRVSMGIAQAGMEPGLMCLLAEWLTPTETGFFISMLLFAICTGFFLGSLCTGFILTIGYGWPLTYYVAGGLNLLVGLIWLFYASSRPSESRLISAKELAHIEASKQIITQRNTQDANNDLKTTSENNLNISSSSSLSSSSTPTATSDEQVVHPVSAEQAPWSNILRTRSVWAFIICKISIRWAADVLGIELPSYLANVLHLSIKLNGILNSVSSALFAIFSFVTGYLVNEILKNQLKKNQSQFGAGGRSYFKISKTNLRKIIQSGASFGSAICMCLMTRYDCNILFSMSMLLVLSCCLVMGTGGELQIPYDMTSKYPGTVHGLACTMSVSGWFAPPLIGLILGDQPSSRYRWNIVWYLTALINLIGGLVFVLFADASPRDFDSPSSDKSGKERRIAKGDEKYGTDTRGRHADLDGYYNAACRSSADTSPVSVERRRLHGQPAALPLAVGDSFPIKQQQEQPNWESHFDRDLIKCRQVEESFIVKPASQIGGYLHHQLDSLATQPVIFPYRAKAEQLSGDTNQKAQVEEASSAPAVEPPQRGILVWRLLRQIGGQRRRKKFSFEAAQRTDEAGGPAEDGRQPDGLPHNAGAPVNNDNLLERSNQQLAAEAARTRAGSPWPRQH